MLPLQLEEPPQPAFLNPQPPGRRCMLITASRQYNESIHIIRYIIMIYIGAGEFLKNYEP